MMDNAVLWGAAILVACYLPLYFNGAPQTGRKCNPSFGSHWVWSFVWRKIIGLPLAESRFRKEDFPDASARFIFGSHPHGVMSLHHIGTMMCPAVCEKGKAFSDLSPIESRRDLAAAILFRIPILREMALRAGAVDADRAVAARMLREGYSVGVLVGGEQEQLLAQPGEHVAFVRRRKGHVRLALRFGVPLVPCYCFGESDLYYQSTRALAARRWLVSKLGIALTLAVGRSYWLPFLPNRVKLVHCVGRPIPVPLVPEPTSEIVDHYHAAFVQGLREVFDEHKASCGYADAELRIV